MRLTINIHCETTAEAEAIIAHLGRMTSAELPIRVQPGDYDPSKPLCRQCNGLGRLCRPDGNPICPACDGSGNAICGPTRDEDEPFHPPVMPSPVAAPPKGRDAPLSSRPMTGAQLLGWVGDQADARAALRRVQSMGKKMGLPWQVKTWKPADVARVFGQLGGAS